MIKTAKLLLIYLFPIVIVFTLFSYSYSSTSIEITLDPAVEPFLDSTDFDTDEMAQQIQDTSDLNGPYVADAFALANILGYPIGKAYIGAFPSFEFGIAGGAGCTNMKYYDKDDPAHDNGTLPMFAPNPVVHVGFGLAGGLDVLGKMFYISKSAVDRYKSDIDYGTDVATLKNYKIYSVGGKLRYNYIKEKKFLPFYLSFGGITFSLGGNFMYGDISFTGDYEYAFEDIVVTGYPTGIPISFNGTYDANIHWAIFTIDAQAIAYFDIFYLFSLYSGFGIAGNIGSFDVEFNGEGTGTTSEPTWPYSSAVGTADFFSQEINTGQAL